MDSSTLTRFINARAQLPQTCTPPYLYSSNILLNRQVGTQQLWNAGKMVAPSCCPIKTTTSVVPPLPVPVQRIVSLQLSNPSLGPMPMSGTFSCRIQIPGGYVQQISYAGSIITNGITYSFNGMNFNQIIECGPTIDINVGLFENPPGNPFTIVVNPQVDCNADITIYDSINSPLGAQFIILGIGAENSSINVGVASINIPTPLNYFPEIITSTETFFSTIVASSIDLSSVLMNDSVISLNSYNTGNLSTLVFNNNYDKFSSISIQNNSFTTFDLTNFTNLTSFICNNNTSLNSLGSLSSSLTSLEIDGTAISGTFDLSSLNSLFKFSCNGTSIDDLGTLPASLVNLSASGCASLTSLTLGSTSALKTINLSNSKFTQASADALAGALISKGLTYGTLNLSGCGVSISGNLLALQDNGWDITI